MNKHISQVVKLSLGPFLASTFIFFQDFKSYAAQIIALISIITIFISLNQKRLSLTAMSFLISTVIFSTGGLSSPVFFLTYFFIFTLASLNPPHVTLTYSLIFTLFLINSLNSLQSALTLISIPFITPLAHYIGKLYQDNLHKQAQIELDDDQINHHETKFFLWFSLILKHRLNSILDSTSQLLSDPKLNYSHKLSLKSIKSQAKTLLKSASNLATDIDTKTDESNQDL